MHESLYQWKTVHSSHHSDLPTTHNLKDAWNDHTEAYSYLSPAESTLIPAISTVVPLINS